MTGQLRVVTTARWLPAELAAAAPADLEVVADLGLDLERGVGDGTSWWCPQRWAARLLASGVDPGFCTPGPGFTADLPAGALGRPVEVYPYGLLRRAMRRDEPVDDIHRWMRGPVHAKLAEAKRDALPATVYRSLVGFINAADAAGLPGEALVQLSEPVDMVTEARCFIVDGTVTAASVYLDGGVTWDGFDRVPDPGWAAEFAQLVADHADGQPPAYCLDGARLASRDLVVVEANPVWCANPYHADRAPVVEAILASQHCTDPLWWWRPDPAMPAAQPIPRRLV